MYFNETDPRIGGKVWKEKEQVPIENKNNTTSRVDFRIDFFKNNIMPFKVVLELKINK